MRVLVLMHEDLIPPQNAKELLTQKEDKTQFFDWEMEYDIT